MNNELYHHGVKGQKWGVRHDKNRVRGVLSPVFNALASAGAKSEKKIQYEKLMDKEASTKKKQY